MSFERVCNQTASTKRPPAIASGIRGVPTTQLSSISCTKLSPVSADLAQTLMLDTPYELKQLFVTGQADIKEGDILVFGGVEYPIKYVGEYERFFNSDLRLHLIVEELKR